eukprot:s770_g7.t1
MMLDASTAVGESYIEERTLPSTPLPLDGWLAGWLAGRVGGWMGGWLAGWQGGWVGGWVDGWMDGWILTSRQWQHLSSPVWLEFTRILLSLSLWDWQMGETIQLVNLHQGMIPGTPYIAYVRATSEVGDAKGWGVPSASHLAPADYPSKPEPPTCPWQWPTALEVHWTEPWTQGSDLESVEFIYSKWEDHSQNAFKVPDDVVHQTFDEKQIHVAALEYATTYYFKYRVKNAVGWSEWSEISQGFITGACRPAPPKKPELEHIDMDRAVSSLLSLHGFMLHDFDLVEFEQLIFKWNRPNSHGCPIDRYEVFLADQDRVAKVKKLVDDLNECSTSEDFEQKVLLDDLPVKDFHEIKVEEFANPALPDHIFEGLLGGLPYAVAVRAHNLEGWSDWSPPLDDIVSPTAAPEEPPAPWLIEAGKDSLHVGFSLPYDNGDIITKAEVAWFRLAGPMERHIALGGKASWAQDFQGFQGFFGV